jgi:hypothetical protein
LISGKICDKKQLSVAFITLVCYVFIIKQSKKTGIIQYDLHLKLQTIRKKPPKNRAPTHEKNEQVNLFCYNLLINLPVHPYKVMVT